VTITCIIEKVDANPLQHNYISIILTANNPGSIIWLSTSATGPQHHIANQYFTVLSIKLRVYIDDISIGWLNQTTWTNGKATIQEKGGTAQANGRNGIT
jgi:hypothetical protein